MRETRSPQRGIYAAAVATMYGQGVFPIRYEVRGVTLDAEKPQAKQLAFVIGEGEAHEAIRHLREKTAMLQTLIEIGQVPWVKNDGGCRIYGDAYKCEFEDACWNGQRHVPTDPVGITRPLSHSSAKEFLRCPERYRALQSLPRVEDDDEETDSTAAGTVFHLLMEGIYQDLRAGVVK